jgi:hypothetical protein
MAPRIELNEDTGLYEFGDDVEGVFIPFASQPKTTVDSRIQSVLADREAKAGPSSTTQAAATAPSDYTDNGDGTYTRQSDGVIGHFGPDGFIANT